MALSYPPHFPRGVLDPVVAAESSAERQFHKAKADAADDRQRLRKAAGEYVTALVLAFARQACAAVRANELSLSDVGWFVDDFERRASVHAYYHLELKRLWSRWESFHDDVIPKIHQSPGWLEHLDERAEAGQAVIAARQDTAKPPSRFPNRAAWLKRQMADRDFSKHYIKVQGGPDHKTIARILDGEPVRPHVIDRLARGLSVPREQIPND